MAFSFSPYGLFGRYLPRRFYPVIQLPATALSMAFLPAAPARLFSRLLSRCFSPLPFSHVPLFPVPPVVCALFHRLPSPPLRFPAPVPPAAAWGCLPTPALPDHSRGSVYALSRVYVTPFLRCAFQYAGMGAAALRDCGAHPYHPPSNKISRGFVLIWWETCSFCSWRRISRC